MLFGFLFITYSYIFNEFPGWNGSSRMDLVYAVVEQGKLNIDTFWNKPGYETYDVAVYKNLHYCDKSPMLSFLGIPAYWVWRQIVDSLNIYATPWQGRYPVVVFAVCLPSAILGVLLFRMLGFIRLNPRDQLLTVFFYSLGTVSFPYSVLFLSHQTSGVFIFACFYFLYLLFKKGDVIKPLILLICGIIGGFGFTIEPLSGIGILGLSLYVLYKLRKKYQIIWFFIGIGLVMLIPMIYNYLCFQSPFSLGYKYELLPVFQSGMAKGIMGITWPKFKAFWGITFSPFRGLFFESPFLLLAIPGFYYLIRRTEFKAEGILALFIFLGFFYCNISYYVWTGGWAAGPRHIIPSLPFLVLAVYPMFPKARIWIILTGILSVIILSIITITEPQVSEEFKYPLFQFNIPRLVDGSLTNNFLTLFGMARTYAMLIWGIFVVCGMGFLYWKAKEMSKAIPET